MSNKTFELLGKYYTISKKYMPFIMLAVIFGISFIVKSFGVLLGIYFGISVLHLAVLVIIKKLLNKQLFADVTKELNNNENSTNEN